MARSPPGRTLLAAAALLAGCSDRRQPLQVIQPVAVSGASPFPAGCNPAAGAGFAYPGSAVEPTLAAHPADGYRLVAAWQQDRWSSGGGADGIAAAATASGGRFWTAGLPPLTHCSGGGAGTWDRATDPWLSFAPDGTAHLVALALDDPWHGSRQAIVASRSLDGGASWSDPVALASDSTPDVALDKCTLTADPGRPGTVYAVWDRLTGQGGPLASQTGPAWLSRSTDGGATWEPARAIFDPGPDAQTISNEVVVLPDGTLVDLLVIVEQLSGASPSARLAVLRSPDAGLGWQDPVTVSPLLGIGARDPMRGGHPVRDGSIVPQLAVDPVAGALYAVWQDARFSSLQRDGIALSRSGDGGLTWSDPVQVNQAPEAQAFTPSVAVGRDGTVAVSYYDFRYGAGDPFGLWTVRWLEYSFDGGATWFEFAIGGPFDLLLAPDVGGYFLGDYAALAAPPGQGFLAAFAMSGPSAPGESRIYAGPPAVAALALLGAPAGRGPARAEAQRVAPRPIRERLRARLDGRR